MTPREAATRTLAEAFMAGIRDETWEGTYPFLSVDAAFIERILAASPTLARWLELGAAWDAVEAALPDAKALGPSLMHYEDYTGKRSWIAEWYAEEGARPTRAWADTPTAALVALAEALREVPR